MRKLTVLFILTSLFYSANCQYSNLEDYSVKLDLREHKAYIISNILPFTFENPQRIVEVLYLDFIVEGATESFGESLSRSQIKNMILKIYFECGSGWDYSMTVSEKRASIKYWPRNETATYYYSGKKSGKTIILKETVVIHKIPYSIAGGVVAWFVVVILFVFFCLFAFIYELGLGIVSYESFFWAPLVLLPILLSWIQENYLAMNFWEIVFGIISLIFAVIIIRALIIKRKQGSTIVFLFRPAFKSKS